jgi:hypothetical protein
VNVDELRRIELLRNLSDERLAGLAEHGRETRLAWARIVSVFSIPS